MAMNDFNIGFLAGLDGTKSKAKLNQDIDAIKKSLKELELKAKLDPNQVKALENQLNTLKVNLNNVSIDKASLNNLVSQINNSLSGIKLQIPNLNVGNIGNQAKHTGQQIGKLISDSAEQAISNVSSKNIGRYFRIDSSTSNQFRAEMEKLVSEWTNAKGKLTDLNIQTRTSYDKETDANITRLHQATVTYKNELDEVIKKTIAWRQIGTTTNDEGEKKILRGFVEVAGQYSKSLDTATAKTDNFVKKQKEAVANLQNTINQITSRAFDSNASKPITSDASLDKLNTQVANVENAMNNLRNATSTTFDDAKIKVQEEISQLKILEKELRNADNVSTKMKGTDVTSGLAIAKNDLEKFKADAKDFPQITQTIKDLDTAISKVGDASSLNSFNDSLRVARSELAKIKSETNASNRNEKVGINISGLQSKIADLQKISPEIDKFETEINGAKVSVQSLLSDLSKISTQSDFSVVSAKFNAFTKAAEASGIAIRDFGNVTDSIAKKANEIQLSMGANGNTTAQIEVLRNNFTKLGLSADEVKTKMSGVDTEVKTLQSLMNSGAENSAIVAQFEKLQAVLTQTQNNLKQTRSDYSLLATEQQRLSLANTIEAWNQKNTAATRAVREECDRYIVSLRDLNTEMSKSQYGKIQNSFKQAENSMRTMNRLGLAFRDQWLQAVNSFKVWVSASTAVMLLIRKIREMPQIVTELDTSLIDLKKTTSMTAAQLEEFYYTANDVAKQMGVTTKEIIDQASAWSRLGYSSQEAATKMAKYSSMFASISPGMDVDTATDGLVSIMKAFDIGNDNPDDVLDGIMSKINIIGNTAATSNAEIVNMLSKSSSAMQEANNTLEETIALETSAVEITRDDDSVGTAFKTVSMRLRGYDEETEEYIGGVEELSGKIADLTKTASTPGGISLFTDDAKTEYKSTYQLLKEISEVYDELDDKTQAQLLEALAGKRQGQILAATINNFEAAEKAMDNMANSAGNAEAEMSVIMDSLDYKLNKNKETWTGVSQNLFQRDDMKAIVDAFTSIGEAVDFATDKLGLFGTIGLGVGLLTSFKGAGRVKIAYPHLYTYACRNKTLYA